MCCVLCSTCACVRAAGGYATLRYGGYDSKTGAKRQPAGVRAVTLQDRYCPPAAHRQTRGDEEDKSGGGMMKGWR
jgi:hypothetical protein